MTLRVNEREFDNLDQLPEALAALLDLGVEVANDAAALAPKRTGAGARSIRAEYAVAADGGREVRVSWDRDHFYMSFAEFGTEHQRATPFLRPAAAKHNT